MSEQKYIEQLEREKKALQDQLNKYKLKKEKKKKFRFWLFKKSSVPFLGVRLKQSITKAITEFKETKTVSVDTVSDVSSNIIWRFTRIGIFAFFMTIIPSLILIFQTKLFVNQNKLVKNQNALIETSRRSSLVFVMDNVMSDLNDELKYKGTSERNISRTLEARIVSLCMAMKPYRYFENGELVGREISPERGQLLYGLLKSDMGKEAFRDILNTADFSYTNLKDVILGRGLFLKYARLKYSDFSNVEMPETNLEGSTLNQTDFTGANLSDSSLIKADLTGAILLNTELSSVDFTYAKLFGADLTNADLTEAKLWGTKLNNANLTNVTLDNVIVNREDWITYVSDSLNLKGAKSISDRYKIKKQGKQQFVIVPKG